MGTGADSWFANSKNTASFLLEWGVPSIGKPWARVKNQKNIHVEINFDNGNIILGFFDQLLKVGESPMKISQKSQNEKREEVEYNSCHQDTYCLSQKRIQEKTTSSDSTDDESNDGVSINSLSRKYSEDFPKLDKLVNPESRFKSKVLRLFSNDTSTSK